MRLRSFIDAITQRTLSTLSQKYTPQIKTGGKQEMVEKVLKSADKISELAREVKSDATERVTEKIKKLDILD